MRHFGACDICGFAGHKAKDCALNQLEQLLDPLGEQQRRASYGIRERERMNRKQQSLSAGMGVQSSPGFGL